MSGSIGVTSCLHLLSFEPRDIVIKEYEPIKQRTIQQQYDGCKSNAKRPSFNERVEVFVDKIRSTSGWRQPEQSTEYFVQMYTVQLHIMYECTKLLLILFTSLQFIFILLKIM